MPAESDRVSLEAMLVLHREPKALYIGVERFVMGALNGAEPFERAALVKDLSTV